jgi:hypothetical protein
LRFNISLICFLLTAVSLYPRAKAEEPALVNTEYTICITAFDVSELPLSQKILGSIIQNRFAAKLAALDIRMRTDAELALYEEAAWNAARGEAAAKLKTKREERDTLLYRGYPGWKYRAELKKSDKEIAVLEEEFARVTDVKPVVEQAPHVKVISGFPEPPQSGNEEVFLQGQGADAVLAGKLSPYYGRIHAEVRLYTRFSSFTYENATVFSIDDLNDAADELSGRAETAVAGREGSRLAVYTEPENARILVNNKKLAVSGETVALNPGEVSVTVTAEDYEPARGTLSLASGETAAADVKLNPFVMEPLRLALDPPEDAGRVYLGALYIGRYPPAGILSGEISGGLEAPDSAGENTFLISLPENYYRYINVETEDGRGASAIVLGGEQRDGRERIMTLTPRPLPGPDEKPVEKRRRQFYGAWGRLWVTFPLYMLLNGFAHSYINSYIQPDYRDKAEFWRNVNDYGWIVPAVFGAESLIRLILYVNAANKEAVPLWE